MDQLDSCINNPNFLIIYSFIQKFSNLLSIPKYTLKQLKENIVHSSEEICQLHQFLLKKIHKSMRAEFWQRNLIKFIDSLTEDESSYLYQKEYYKLSIASKLTILKNLLESQFDDNNDLKNDLVNSEGDSLRESPIGFDNLGSFYWFHQDIDGNIYLYKENNQNQCWELLCQEREGLVLTIESLKSVYDNLIKKLILSKSANNDLNKELCTKNNLEVGVIDKEVTGNNTKYSNNTKDVQICCNGDSPSLVNEPLPKSDATQSRCSSPSQEPNKMVIDTEEPLEDRRRVLRQSIRRGGNKIQDSVILSPQLNGTLKTKKSKTYNRCTQCGKTKPSAILTCLDCQAFYHPTCIPQSYYIVDEDTQWYCPLCQHKRLIVALEEKLAWLDSFTESQRQIARKKERLAIAGINIANILDYSKETLGLKFGAAPQASDLSKISALTGVRSCRIKKHISYQFDEYDKLMDKAIKEQNNADPKIAPKDSAPPSSLGHHEDSDSSYASTRRSTSSPRLSENVLPKIHIQSRQPEHPTTHLEPGNLDQCPAPTNLHHRPVASPASLAFEPPDVRPKRNKKRPDRFDEQLGEEDRRYGVSSSSDSSEFEYGYKPRKTTRSRRLKADRDISLEADAYDDGYFMTRNQRAMRTTKGAAHDKKVDYGSKTASPIIHKDPPEQLVSLEIDASTRLLARPDPHPASIATRLVSDDTPSPLSYYKPAPTPKTSPPADSHPLLNLCHMTSLYPDPGPAGSVTPTPPKPSPLPKTLVVRPRARPPQNCILFPVVNNGNGLLVQPTGGPPTHPSQRQAGSVPEPSITVIEVNALLNNVIPKTSLW